MYSDLCGVQLLEGVDRKTYLKVLYFPDTESKNLDALCLTTSSIVVSIKHLL